MGFNGDESMRETVQETIYRMDASTVDFMVKHIITDLDLLSECKDTLKCEYFLHDEAVYKVLISNTYFYAQTSFSNLKLTSEVVKVCISDDEMVRACSTLKNTAFQIIDEAYSSPADSFESNRQLCRSLIQRFVIERGVHDKMYSALSSSASVQAVLKNPQQFFDKFQSVYGSSQALNNSVMCDLIPSDWKPVARIGKPMGIPHFDKFMSGGTSPGDVYAILAGFASGKTWMLLQVAANHAIQEYFREQEHIEKGLPFTPNIAIYANYEGSVDSLRYRLLAVFTSIPVNIIKDHIINKSLLSTRDNLKDYELQKYAKVDNKDLWLSESDRYSMVPNYAKYIKILDMSGQNDSNVGSGYVEELCAQIDKYVRSNKCGVGVACVDYAKLLADRHASKVNQMEQLRHFIRRIPSALAVGIGLKYSCAVWINQQISGEANSTKPHKLLHHSMSSECKDFGENCHRIFCLGAKDPESGVQILNASKLRDEEAPGLTYTTVKFNGTSCVYEIDDTWDVDNHGFVKKSFSGSSMDVGHSVRFAPLSFDDRDE